MIERNPIDERISGLVRSVRAGVPDALEARNGAEVLVASQHRQPMLERKSGNPGIVGRDGPRPNA